MAGIDPLGGVGALLRTAVTTGAGPVAAPGELGGPAAAGTAAGIPSSTGVSGSFIDSLGEALGGLNAQLNSADAAMTSFAAGGSADLHSVMLELQQASIGLKAGIAVRDKLLEAYQELMRLQI
jgi:flagellar hook-basal body complex protein FliE